MPKLKNKRRFGRISSQRKALMYSLTAALVDKEKITTTEAKAKELRPIVEKMITTARKNTVYSRRLIERRLTPKLTKKIINEIGPRYKERQGGYTRITKLGPRKTDGARMAVIEFV